MGFDLKSCDQVAVSRQLDRFAAEVAAENARDFQRVQEREFDRAIELLIYARDALDGDRTFGPSEVNPMLVAARTVLKAAGEA